MTPKKRERYVNNDDNCCTCCRDAPATFEPRVTGEQADCPRTQSNYQHADVGESKGNRVETRCIWVRRDPTVSPVRIHHRGRPEQGAK